MSAIERRFTLSIPRDESEGSWDRYGFWPLSDECAVAFVADAPVAALRDSGRIIELAIGESIERGSAEIENAIRLGLGAVVVADLATIASDALIREGSGSAYAAVAIVAMHRGEISVFCRGDCAVYVGTEAHRENGAVLRLSGTTRVDGRAVLPGGTAEKMVADHYEEGVYLGGASRIFEPGEAWTVPGQRVLMVSDGCEGQAGASKLLAFLNSDDFSKETIRRLVEESPPRDDICALGIEIAGAERAAIPISQEPSGDVAAVRRTEVLELELAEMKERLAEVERALAESKAHIPAPSGQEVADNGIISEQAIPVDFAPPTAASAGDIAGPALPKAGRVSLVRRIFGVLLSLAALAAIGWLSWFLYHQFLDELDEDQTSPGDPASEVSEPIQSGEEEKDANEDGESAAANPDDPTKNAVSPGKP